jgi:hypothetical protein
MNLLRLMALDALWRRSMLRWYKKILMTIDVGGAVHVPLLYMLLVSLSPVDDRGRKVCETELLDGVYEDHTCCHVLCWVFRRSAWKNT